MGDMDILEVLDSSLPDTLLQGWGPLRKNGIMIKTLGADVIPMLQTLEGMRGYMGVNEEVYFFTGVVVFTRRCYFHQLGPLGRVGLVVDMSMCCVLCVVCLSVPFPCNFF